MFTETIRSKDHSTISSSNKPLANGTMSPEHLCCQEGGKEWVAAASLFHTPPPPPTPLKPPPFGFLNRISAGKIPIPSAIRLPKFVKIGLIGCGGFVGPIVLICIFGAIFGSNGPSTSSVPTGVSRRLLIQDRLNEVNRKIDETNNDINNVAMRLFTMGNQANEVEARGQILTPDSKHEFMTTATELAAMGEVLNQQKKTLTAEQEDLRRQLAQ